jgi:hypothetical protein
MGQAISGESPSSGTNYIVESGYIGREGFAFNYNVYLPLILRN